MLFLAHVLLTVAGHSFWNSYTPLCPQFPHLRLSFALNSKFTSSALPTDPNDFPALLCTSELCKEENVELQLYCIDREQKIKRKACVCQPYLGLYIYLRFGALRLQGRKFEYH